MVGKEAWLTDTGIACNYDQESIEFTDPVVCLKVVQPIIKDGLLSFFDVQTEDQGDYYYEPVFFHSTNWDKIEEGIHEHATNQPKMEYPAAILECDFCQSGIGQGETMGLATFGEIHRTERVPDMRDNNSHFEAMDSSPSIICIVCLDTMNKEVAEVWPDGVAHDYECEEGRYMRCWRMGCAGNCKGAEEEVDEEE